MKMKLFLSLCVGLFLAAMQLPSSAAVPAGKRVALVIGNSGYQHAVTLANPERDAKAVAAKMRELGFVVVEGYDLDHDGMEDVVKDFAKAVQGADVGLFYYAGHGMQVNGNNYLVPVDAAFQDIGSLDFEAIPMDLVTRQMENDVAVRLVVLDACHDNPLSKTLSRSMGGGSRSTAVAEGLAEMKIKDADKGTAIVFATSPDQVALDGEGDHSPFTTALLDNIGAPDTDFSLVITRITRDVLASTEEKQRPWITASFTGPVYLNGQHEEVAQGSGGGAEVVIPSPVTGNQNVLERETALYNLARESGQREDYQAFLETFPDGLYAANARKQIERLDQAGKETEVASVEQPQPVPSGDTPRSVAPAGVDLPVTDAVKAMAADAMTEASLELDKAKRTEIQTRLNLAGYGTGTPDGSFGNRTRTALKSWQASRGLSQSGFLNQPQYEILMQQTETAFASYVPPVVAPAVTQPQAQRATPRRAETRRAAQRNGRYTTRRAQHRSGGGRSAEVGRFVGGVLRGVLGR